MCRLLPVPLPWFAATGRSELLPSLAWLSLEIDNIRAVLRTCVDRGDLAHAVGMATSLIWYWITRATTEGVRWLDELLAGPVAHPWTYFARGYLGVLQNDPAAATRALDRGMSMARAAGRAGADPRHGVDRGDHERRPGVRAPASRRGPDRREWTGRSGRQALNGLVDGDLDAVATAAAEGARLSREAGDLYSLGMMLMNQGYAALRLGAHQIDDRVAQCYLVGALGCRAAADGEPRLAAELLGAMEKLRAEIGAGVHPGMAPALTEATRSATAALGTAAFDAACHTGRQLSRDAAVRLALREAAAPAVTANSDGLSRRETDLARLVTKA